MNSPQNNEGSGYSNLAERHRRRPGAATAAAATRPRGLPAEPPRDAVVEEEYQARYEKQLRDRRQQRATERRTSRQREILSGRVEKRKVSAPLNATTWRWIKFALIGFGCLLVLGAGVAAYEKLTGSRLFTLREIDLQGTHRASRQEMLQALSGYKSRSLWQLDLQVIRAALEKNPWVLEAEVSRVLPDSLRVIIHEREPLAPWLTPGNAIVWVDREGRNLGELDFNQTAQVPPIVSGLEEGTTDEVKTANQQRMNLYQKLLAELDRQSPKLSEEIDEVSLQDVQAVKVHLLKHRVSVLLGNTDFRMRLEKGLTLLQKIEQKNISSIGFLNKSDAERLVNGDRIAYLNMTRPDHIVVGFAN